MEQLQYIVEDSTIAELLGVRNFSTKEAAVLELVKNAYDAQATELDILISPDEIKIKDNGHGMSIETIRSQWMHVGKSSKGYMENGRIMAGSKGIGRFALARLGKRVVVTSQNANDTPVCWSTDWNVCTVEPISTKMQTGTEISIFSLRDKWNKQSINQLIDFLSRSYMDTVMQIKIRFGDEVFTVSNYLSDIKMNRDYIWRIEMQYHAEKKELEYTFTGDEFLDTAQSYCTSNIKFHSSSISMADEMTGGTDFGEKEDVQSGLSLLGDFSVSLFFQNKPNSEDVAKFLYKKRSEMSKKANGVVLYRNAFSIVGHEGTRDWLELGKRSRKSPAAASHPTGAWRVRENQMTGLVKIDKQENAYLTDLSNRQGMEENIFYNLFVEIITTGIACFERYRQGIIRGIDIKNTYVTPENNAPILKRVLANPKAIASLDPGEQKSLIEEIRTERKQTEQQQSTWTQAEQRYRYDIRLLNILATLGLRSSSMAHEMNNDRSAIVTNCENIINALRSYGYWDELTSPEKTKIQYRNIPALLEIAGKVEAKMVSFMDVMLSEIEKNKFKPMQNDIFVIVHSIAKKWSCDYAKLEINVQCDEELQFWIAEDIIIAIFDNLILNSVQQNDSRSALRITIKCDVFNERLWFFYADDGVGLIPKYRTNPSRILEVHETSRDNGHGLGMWIVNNSIHYTGGKILEITGDKGFCFEFELGREV